MPVLLGAGIWLRLAGGADIGWRYTVPFGLVLVFLLWRQRFRLFLALPLTVVCCLLVGITAADVRLAALRTPVLIKDLPYAQIRGQILSLSEKAAGRVQIDIAPDSVEHLAPDDTPVRLRLFSYKSLSVRPGERVELAAKLWPPGEPVAPGAFDYRRYLGLQRIGALGTLLSSPIKLGDAEGPEAWLRRHLFTWRRAVATAVLQGRKDQASAVAVALMTGDRGRIHKQTDEALRGSGLAHILAISGMHMALLTGAVFYSVRLLLAAIPGLVLRYPVKNWAAAIALASALFYLVLTGASIATQRAFVMAAFVLAAVILDRPALTMRNVSLAAMAVLLIAPESLMSASFQMSFAAVVALVGVYETVQARMPGRLSGRATSRINVHVLGFYIRGLLLTSFVAGLATAPFAAFHFNRVATYGLIGNLAAMPLAGLVVMPAAVASFALMPFGLEAAPLAVMKWGIDWVLIVAAEVSAWSGAVRMVPAGPPLALGAIVLGGLWLALWRTPWRFLGLLPVLAGVVLWAMAPLPTLLISPDGALAAMRNQQGHIEFSARAPKWTQEQWLRRDGDQRSAKAAYADSIHWRCDSEACLYVEEGGLKVSVLKRKTALSDDCQWADIVVASFYVRKKHCPSAYIIDRAVLQGGALALYWKDGDIQIDKARSHQAQ